MAYSLTFNSIDLGDYDLIVTSSGINSFHQVGEYAQLQTKGYSFKPKRSPRLIALDCQVTGTSRSNLDDNLDNIRLALVESQVKQLILDTITGRYFNAILESFDGDYKSAGLFDGKLSFVCPDPLGHSTTETDSDFNIDSDPDTIIETTEGTGDISPVFTLKAGEDLTDVTIKVENLTSEEELQWTGSLANTEELEINVPLWIAYKEGTASMSSVTGQFPHLIANAANSIKVTAFSNTGTLNIKYRNTYL